MNSSLAGVRASLNQSVIGQDDLKQALLEAPTLETRRETLVTLMEFALRGGSEEGSMQ